MTETRRPDTSEVMLEHFVLKGVQSVTLLVKVKPRNAAVLVYRSPGEPHAIRCNAPLREITIGFGTGRFHVQQVDGATSFEIIAVTWE